MHFLALLPLLALPWVSASPVQHTKRYSGVKIQSYRNRKCLSPIGTAGDGMQVTTVACAQAKTWDINPGSGSVLLHENNKFALDAGTGRDNNEIVKLWTSYPTLFQQTWYLTGDKRIAITGGDQCLDEGDTGSQTWRCTTGNTNQIWFVVGGGDTSTPSSTPAAASSSVQPSATSSTASTPSQSSGGGGIFKDPSNTSRRIHPNNHNDLCVTAGNGVISVGSSVNIANCYATDNAVSKSQLWNIAAGSTANYIRSASDQNFCLDIGGNPGSGSHVYVSNCSSSANSGTKFSYMADKIQVDGKNLCLDLELNSGRTAGSPIDYQGDLQVWECFAGNTQQIFTLYPL
ncbi:uncharacterized protein IL334_000016 [Kwoniella shivajii]|uniref:Ricin B lectin domain-containing protein n=1 Tax=Kwoniella shivajii TaxID=564305 RepID=A0ABZ1CMZ1_9TREE|nr:hypothetical protein IL334_000016 [Kwoniella shivajii]